MPAGGPLGGAPRSHNLVGLREYAVFWAGSAGAVVVLGHSSDADFARYFGETPPLIAVGVVGAAGLVALRALTSEGWLTAEGMRAFRRGAGSAAKIAAMFGVAILVADYLGRFPENINVSWPQALLFYPAIGFVAEVAFHLIPLSLLSPLVRKLANWDKGQRSYIIVSIAAVALLEAAFQVLATGSAKRNPTLSAYMGLHLLGFGGAQLAVMRRHGFASMALMRLVYYAIWHILWGRLRLALLY